MFAKLPSIAGVLVAAEWHADIESRIVQTDVAGMDSVNQDGRVNDNHLGRRIDASELLPELTRCLT